MLAPSEVTFEWVVARPHNACTAYGCSGSRAVGSTVCTAHMSRGEKLRRRPVTLPSPTTSTTTALPAHITPPGRQGVRIPINTNRTVIPFLTAEAVVELVDETDPELDICGMGRSREAARLRHIAAYLCYRFTDSPYDTIGDALGGRDHSTILHSVRKVEGDAAIIEDAESIARDAGWID